MQVLGGLLAGVVAIAAPRANAIEIIDGTKLRQSGFDIIYNARDLDKSQVGSGLLAQAASVGSSTSQGPRLSHDAERHCRAVHKTARPAKQR